MKTYDPNVAPVPDEWFLLSEFERFDIVEAFHRRAGGFGGNLRLHAAIQVAVENQLAAGDPAQANEALARLLQDGLDRHDAVHAIGSVLTEYLFPILQASADPPEVDTQGYAMALRDLTVERWRGGG